MECGEYRGQAIGFRKGEVGGGQAEGCKAVGMEPFHLAVRRLRPAPGLVAIGWKQYGASSILGLEQPTFGGGIGVEVAMAIEMVGTEAGQDGDLRPAVGGYQVFGLEAGKFHHQAVFGAKRQHLFQQGAAKVAGEQGPTGQALEQMRAQGGAGRFAVGPGDGHGG